MDSLLGIALVILSATAFGALPILGRYAYADGMDALTILFLRFTLAAALMALWLTIRRERLPRGPVFWRLVGMGALGSSGSHSPSLRRFATPPRDWYPCSSTSIPFSWRCWRSSCCTNLSPASKVEH